MWFQVLHQVVQRHADIGVLVHATGHKDDVTVLMLAW